jgi:hypothetical protein
MVVPILTYGCEVWGVENLDMIECFHRKFCKILLNARASTANCIAYGELGRFPLEIAIKSRLLSFWSNLASCKTERLAALMYKIVYTLHCTNKFESQWLIGVKSILDQCGLSDIWLCQSSNVNPQWLKRWAKMILQDQFRQSWYADIEAKSCCRNYKMFKTDFSLSHYLLLLPPLLRNNMCRFRTCNNRLPVVTGQFTNTPIEERYCNLCNSNALGDGFHYLFSCTYFKSERDMYIDKAYSTNPNLLKYESLMSTDNKLVLFKLARFCGVVIDKFK